MAMEKDMLESLEFQELPNSNSGKYKFLSIYIEEYTDQVFFSTPSLPIRGASDNRNRIFSINNKPY